MNKYVNSAILVVLALLHIFQSHLIQCLVQQILYVRFASSDSCIIWLMHCCRWIQWGLSSRWGGCNDRLILILGCWFCIAQHWTHMREWQFWIELFIPMNRRWMNIICSIVRMELQRTADWQPPNWPWCCSSANVDVDVFLYSRSDTGSDL